MPYKKIYYTIHCPKCNKDYQVLPQAYFRKQKDPKYGSLCVSCRAKVLWEEKTPEERELIKNRSNQASKAKYKSMTDEEKQKMINKRTEGTKKYWANMSNNEKKEKSIKRSNDRKKFINNLTKEELKEIGNKISKTKLITTANMTDEQRAERKLIKQQEREKYWNSLSDEEKNRIIEILRNNNKRYITNMTDNEREKLSKIMTERNKEFWDSKSKEERKELSQKLIKGNKEWRDNLTEDQIKELNKCRSESMVEYWDNLSDDELKYISATRSNSRKMWLASLSDEDYDLYKNSMSEYMKQYWDNLSPEYREIRAEENRNQWNNLTDEQKELLINQNKERWENYTQQEKDNITDKRLESFKKYIDNLTDQERDMISKRAKDVWDKKSNKEKENHIQKLRNYYSNLTDYERNVLTDKQHRWLKELTPQQRKELSKKIFSNKNRINSSNIRFENYFNESHLINDYYFKSEILIGKDIVHSWDYGIYNRNTNELVMVVDIDGAYYHADISDYNGLHSKEEYDERRSLSIDPSRNIKPFIIQELNFSKCFELLVKTLMMNYDEYVDYIFKMCRSMPFPTPKYNDKELIKSFKELINLDSNKYEYVVKKSNTRNGDRIITHFHPSIYQANRKGKISPYEAWYDDKLLKKCIENRIIYQTYLNPNKILQGFNVSKVAQKVSVFSAGRAKILINRYLSDCNEVFDPFSGFSGRMLGCISLGKKYIGQDISEIHTRESNEIIKFLNINTAIVTCKDILESSGSYECLFTCSPYSDKEQWLEVPVSKYTCDNWIDECLSRFKCKKYLFVVDNTTKYNDYIVDEIVNKSHLNKNSEYVILIEK